MHSFQRLTIRLIALFLVLGVDLRASADPLPAESEARATVGAGAATSGQDAHHALFLEAGGVSLLYSLNYEYRPAQWFGVGAGASVLPICMFDTCGAIPTLSASARGIFFDGDHHLEAGAGVLVALVDDEDARFIVPQIGYRYDQKGGGLLFRATFTPLFRLGDLSDALAMGGLSFGYTF